MNRRLHASVLECASPLALLSEPPKGGRNQAGQPPIVRAPQSARGLAHSKTWRTSGASREGILGPFRGLAVLVLISIMALNASAAAPRLEVERTADNNIRLSWTKPADLYSLEATRELKADAVWQTVPEAVVPSGEKLTVTLGATETTRFFRLRLTGDPLLADPDGDGLTNAEESQANTDPLKEDSDGDGWADEVEVHDGSNPRDPASRPQVLVWCAPPVNALITTPAEVLAANPGPVVARPPVTVAIVPDAEEAPAGPYLARPEVNIFREPETETAAAGPWIARPGVSVVRVPETEVAPPGPWVARPPVNIVREPEAELAKAVPWWGRPPVSMKINRP